MESRSRIGSGNFEGGKGRPVVKYRDTLRSSAQKRLNRLICRLGCGLGVGRRKHKFSRIRQMAPMCPHERAHWCHTANRIEPSICGGNVALFQITLTTYYKRSEPAVQDWSFPVLSTGSWNCVCEFVVLFCEWCIYFYAVSDEVRLCVCVCVQLRLWLLCRNFVCNVLWLECILLVKASDAWLRAGQWHH